jgi:hypothetical protein
MTQVEAGNGSIIWSSLAKLAIQSFLRVVDEKNIARVER